MNAELPLADDAKSTEQHIMARMRRAGRGSVWSAAQFRGLAQRNALDQTLTRMLRKGLIRRICHGLYLYPQFHPMLGEVPATLPSVFAALNATEPTPLVASGAYACFLLGMIRDMPGEIVLLSATTTRDIQLATVRMRIRIAAPRYLAGAGRLSGVLIQAWRHMGIDQVDDAHIAWLRNQIPAVSRHTLQADESLAPAWMHGRLRQLYELKIEN
jgi:hypothetical protein